MKKENGAELVFEIVLVAACGMHVCINRYLMISDIHSTVGRMYSKDWWQKKCQRYNAFSSNFQFQIGYFFNWEVGITVTVDHFEASLRN